MYDLAEKRLKSFGYVLNNNDKILLKFSVEKAENTVKNECNVSEVPDGLLHIAVDMAVGEFLKLKLGISPQDITGLDLDHAVKSIQVGDTKTDFAVGETFEQKLAGFVNYLLGYGRGEFACYRKIRW